MVEEPEIPMKTKVLFFVFGAAGLGLQQQAPM